MDFRKRHFTKWGDGDICNSGKKEGRKGGREGGREEGRKEKRGREEGMKKEKEREIKNIAYIDRKRKRKN